MFVRFILFFFFCISNLHPPLFVYVSVGHTWFLFQLFIELERILKCSAQKGGIFVLEEFGKTYAFPSLSIHLF